jgi:hypothetical protein
VAIEEDLAMTWNLFIYMAGDNDLADVARQTRKVLAQTTVADGVNIRVHLDLPKGAGAIRLSFPSPPGPRPVRLGKVNDGDPNTLKDFLAWAQGSTPAGRDALVIWDHGGGRLGLDEGAAGDFLENREIDEALKNPLRPLDLIGCDACLTGNIDLVRAVADHAAYYVAPETIIARDGWPYRKIIDALRRTPGMEPAELARTIVDAYKTGSRPEVVAAWDLEKIKALLANVDALGDALAEILTKGRPARHATVRGSRRRMVAMDDPDYLDLDTCLAQLATVQGARVKVKKCQDALADARVHRSKRSSLSGMSILLPDGEDQQRPKVGRIAGKGGWNRFLRAFG